MKCATTLFTFTMLFALPASATVVGNIQVCYACNNNFDNLGNLDGPTFGLFNTSGSPITGGVFTVEGDAFSVPTISAGGSVVLVPGVSTDGAGHVGFWAFLNRILDTSDEGPSADTTAFSFTGFWNGMNATTGVFTPQATIGPSNDLRTDLMNFLGGGPASDVSCFDCFGPTTVALIDASPASAPEPSEFLPVASLLLVVGGAARRGAMGERLRRR